MIYGDEGSSVVRILVLDLFIIFGLFEGVK